MVWYSQRKLRVLFIPEATGAGLMQSDNEPPVVSVLVTVFNRESFLAECLSSILASTWTNFEIIVVDDQSTDSSFEVAASFAELDPRIRLFRNESNLGDYPNRNRAASLAIGKYLKFLDADDVIYPQSLELMVTSMRAHPEAALGLSWSTIDPHRAFPFVSSPRETYAAHYLGVSLLGVGPSASIIQKTAFDDVGGFSGKRFVGDSELWLRLVERWPLVSLPPSLVWWRRHEGQQMSAEQSDANVLNVRYEIEERFLDSSSLLDETEKRRARIRMKRRHARRLVSLALHERRLGDAIRSWRKSRLTVTGTLAALMPEKG